MRYETKENNSQVVASTGKPADVVEESGWSKGRHDDAV